MPGFTFLKGEKMNKYIPLIVLLTLSFNTYANGDSGWRNIVRVKIEGKSFISVHSETPWANPDGCGQSNLAIIPMTDEAHHAKLSLALSAFMGGKKISLWLTGCQQTPWGYTAPVIYTMNIGN